MSPPEVTDLRGILGALAWRANQTSPLTPEIGLLLCEVPVATVDALNRANKLVREAQRTADQVLVFHPFGLDWTEFTTVVWADAAQNNRPRKGSTVGLVACLAPREMENSDKVRMNVVTWRSTKAPRESLGSNGSEIQAITIGEDVIYLIRSLWMEIHGVTPARGRQDDQVKLRTRGVLAMDY